MFECVSHINYFDSCLLSKVFLFAGGDAFLMFQIASRKKAPGMSSCVSTRKG